MDDFVSTTVGDISAAGRRSLEDLVGHDLPPDHQVLIMVFKPQPEPDPATRRRLIVGIQQLMAQARANADVQQVSDAEFDAAVEEAMSVVRPRS